jgi:hypothetical protein
VLHLARRGVHHLVRDHDEYRLRHRLRVRLRARVHSVHPLDHVRQVRVQPAAAVAWSLGWVWVRPERPMVRGPSPCFA